LAIWAVFPIILVIYFLFSPAIRRSPATGAFLPRESVVGPGTRVAPLKHSHSILATGRFVELGTDDRNIYFTEKFH
jgi:hypothetical protein